MKKYYGSETEKSLKNFSISRDYVDLRLIKAVAEIKIASSYVNYKNKLVSKGIHEAIVKVSKEILKGVFDDQFLTGSVQGGAGTSINMNVNEVIATRSSEFLKGKEEIHFLDQVNKSQSTNDVVPTALRLVCLRFIDEYEELLVKLEEAFSEKAKQFSKVVKVGRTHLQDAVPITLGAEFKAYASFVKRDRKRILESRKYLRETNLGGTAVGTGINTPKGYAKDVNIRLSEITGYRFKPSNDLVDATQNLDVFLYIINLLQISSLGLSKISNDIKLMASGPRAGLGEIILPRLQEGSSIMPGKNNPVVFEAVNQVSNHIAGNATACSLALLEGQLELNTMFPTFLKAIIESFDMLINVMPNFIQTIKSIGADSERCRRLMDNSLIMATRLSRYIGHEEAGKLVRRAINNQTSLKEEVIKEGVVSDKLIENIFNKA